MERPQVGDIFSLRSGTRLSWILLVLETEESGGVAPDSSYNPIVETYAKVFILNNNKVQPFYFPVDMYNIRKIIVEKITS